jgi:hypothetical protein
LKTVELIDLGVIEGGGTEAYKLPFALKDADVEIEGSDEIQILKMEKLADGFSLIAVAVDSRTASDAALVLNAETSDKILKCEGRMLKARPVKLIGLSIEKDESASIFKSPAMAEDVEGADASRTPQVENYVDSSSNLITVACDPGQWPHSPSEPIVESRDRILADEGQLGFGSDSTQNVTCEESSAVLRSPKKIRTVESVDLKPRKGKSRLSYKLVTRERASIVVSASGPEISELRALPAG